MLDFVGQLLYYIPDCTENEAKFCLDASNNDVEAAIKMCVSFLGKNRREIHKVEPRQVVMRSQFHIHESKGMCRICTKCACCTGYGHLCANNTEIDRSDDKGHVCGCGLGEGGCEQCGQCIKCCELTQSGICPGPPDTDGNFTYFTKPQVAPESVTPTHARSPSKGPTTFSPSAPKAAAKVLGKPTVTEGPEVTGLLPQSPGSVATTAKIIDSIEDSHGLNSSDLVQLVRSLGPHYEIFVHEIFNNWKTISELREYLARFETPEEQKSFCRDFVRDDLKVTSTFQMENLSMALRNTVKQGDGISPRKPSVDFSIDGIPPRKPSVDFSIQLKSSDGDTPMSVASSQNSNPNSNSTHTSSKRSSQRTSQRTSTISKYGIKVDPYSDDSDDFDGADGAENSESVKNDCSEKNRDRNIQRPESSTPSERSEPTSARISEELTMPNRIRAVPHRSDNPHTSELEFPSVKVDLLADPKEWRHGLGATVASETKTETQNFSTNTVLESSVTISY